jgi:hypothetical protein
MPGDDPLRRAHALRQPAARHRTRRAGSGEHDRVFILTERREGGKYIYEFAGDDHFSFVIGG